jgi:hypothetical protein
MNDLNTIKIIDAINERKRQKYKKFPFLNS